MKIQEDNNIYYVIIGFLLLLLSACQPMTSTHKMDNFTPYSMNMKDGNLDIYFQNHEWISSQTMHNTGSRDHSYSISKRRLMTNGLIKFENKNYNIDINVKRPTLVLLPLSS